jgi:hypothetical protein
MRRKFPVLFTALAIALAGIIPQAEAHIGWRCLFGGYHNIIAPLSGVIVQQTGGIVDIGTSTEISVYCYHTANSIYPCLACGMLVLSVQDQDYGGWTIHAMSPITGYYVPCNSGTTLGWDYNFTNLPGGEVWMLEHFLWQSGAWEDDCIDAFTTGPVDYQWKYPDGPF